MYLFGGAPGPPRCYGPGSGCPGLRCAAVLRTAPVGRSLIIPHLLLPRLSEAPDTTRQRARPRPKKRRPSLPRPTARAGRHSTAGATLRYVPSFAAYRCSFVHYACRPPSLRSVPRSTHPPAVAIVTRSYARPRPAPPPKSRPGRATNPPAGAGRFPVVSLPWHHSYPSFAQRAEPLPPVGFSPTIPLAPVVGLSKLSPPAISSNGSFSGSFGYGNVEKASAQKQPSLSDIPTPRASQRTGARPHAPQAAPALTATVVTSVSGHNAPPSGPNASLPHKLPCRAGPEKGPTPPVSSSRFGCGPQAQKPAARE